MAVRLVIFGRQGAGKGTQSARLSAHYGAPHISTGDMLRAAVANATPIGLEAKSYMDSGQLVPDEVMLGVVEERLQQPRRAGERFPARRLPPHGRRRPRPWAGSPPSTSPSTSQVPEEIVLERISSRRVCTNCGRIYSIESPPASNWTCDTCGGEVVQRADDTPEAVAKRLAAYATETQPTIDWYSAASALVAVDGLGTPDEVTARLIAAVDARLAG